MNPASTHPHKSISRGAPHPWVLVARITVLGALFGLLTGLVEAGRLFISPRPPLLRPDVSSAIWFLAPLIDLCGGALVGFTLGLAHAEAFWKGIRRQIAKLFAICLGVPIVIWTFVRVCGFVIDVEHHGLSGRYISLWFAVCAGIVLLGCRHRPGWIHALIERQHEPCFKHVALAIGSSVTILVFGLTVYASSRSLPFLFARTASDRASDKPNIVLITLDTVRADHLSFYGYPHSTSPNLERWARQGVVFDNALSASSWTLASHASIFTGVLPHQHGATWARPLDSPRWTLAKALEAAGYETAGFTANLYYGPAGWGMQRGFQVYEDGRSSIRHNLEQTFIGGALVQPLYASLWQDDRLDRRDAKKVNDDIFGWFQRRSGQPFFLFVNYFDVHEPYLPSSSGGNNGHLTEALVEKAKMVMSAGESADALSAQEREQLIASYDNCLRSLDSELDLLLKFLPSQPGWSNTVVIITADHGEAFGEHGTYGHGLNLNREVLHVPLVILGPGIPAGQRLQDIAPTRKLFATVLDLALGGKPPFDHTSLRRMWMPGFTPDPFDEITISELISPSAPRTSYLSLVTPEWHLLEDSTGHQALYDWINDPAERVDVSGIFPVVTNRLAARLTIYVASSLRPWTEPRYLAPLSVDSAPFNRIALKGDAVPLPWAIGTSQAYFPSEKTGPSSEDKVSKENDELLRSLPYN